MNKIVLILLSASFAMLSAIAFITVCRYLIGDIDLEDMRALIDLLKELIRK